MSFAELHYPHQVIRVDLDGGAVREIASLQVPRPVDLLRIPQDPAPVDEVIEALKALQLPDRRLEARPYLQVRVRLTGPEPGLRAKIETVLDQKPVRLARIEPTYVRGHADDGDCTRYQSLEDLERLKPEDIFRKLYRSQYPDTEPDTALLTAFNELLNVTETPS